MRLAGIFGGRFTSQFGEVDDGTWLAVLKGLDRIDLLRGLAKVARSEACADGWPPNAREFRTLCLPDPADLGLPTAEEAFRLACRRQWDPPIVWHARKQVGSFAMNRSEHAWTAFQTAYQSLVHRAAAGERFDLPPSPPAISHDPVPTGGMTAEEARQAMLDRWGRSR